MKNKKIIDLDIMIRDANIKNVSIHLLIKRELNYRVIKEDELLKCKNCLTCKASKKVKYLMDKKTRFQCVWVGIMDDPYSDIDHYHICNFYENGFEKNLLNEGKGENNGKNN